MWPSDTVSFPFPLSFPSNRLCFSPFRFCDSDSALAKYAARVIRRESGEEESEEGEVMAERSYLRMAPSLLEV